jgi:hypothetical protein
MTSTPKMTEQERRARRAYQDRQRYAADPEKARERQREKARRRRAANPEIEREKARQRRAANLDHYRQYGREYAQKNRQERPPMVTFYTPDRQQLQEAAAARGLTVAGLIREPLAAQGVLIRASWASPPLSTPTPTPSA